MKKLTMTKKLKKRGGGSMKKLNNNKGFSLIELLIVIAIMGVLAVIAFNMFSGVLGNSKKRADEQQANQIKKAVEILMTDSAKANLQGLFKADGTTAITITSGTTPSTDLLVAMQDIIKDSNGKEYGPLLANPNPATSASASNYVPQWNTVVGGSTGYVGFAIDVYPTSNTCKVKPVSTGAVITIYP